MEPQGMIAESWGELTCENAIQYIRDCDWLNRRQGEHVGLVPATKRPGMYRPVPHGGTDSSV